AKLDAHGMDFLANAFNKSGDNETWEQDQGTVFNYCNLQSANLDNYYREDWCKDCSIDPDSIYLEDGITPIKYIY
ncbi:hypothetical protein U0B20_27730, partial [Escherichia coli]|nr:hypothetical protein [Escherichia coli]